MNTSPLLGPEGVQQRIAELQKKLDSVCGPSFDSFVASAPSGLSGSIGNPFSSSLGGDIRGNVPFNPMAPGAKIAPEAPADLRGLISDAAEESGVDDTLFDALISVESGYNPTARSKAGALGLSQLMPDTAKSLGVDPLDPKSNLRGGAKYLAQLLKEFGSAPLALAAYNAGPGAVRKAGNAIPPYPETEAYVNRIMAIYNARKKA